MVERVAASVPEAQHAETTVLFLQDNDKPSQLGSPLMMPYISSSFVVSDGLPVLSTMFVNAKEWQALNVPSSGVVTIESGIH
jgi:hypothetical protein